MGISPLRVFRAMSLIERIFAREKPARRILRASMVAMSSGRGKRRPGKERDEAPQDRLGGAPVDLLVRDGPHQRLERQWLRTARPQGPTRRMSARITGSTLARCRIAGLLIAA